MRALRVDVDGIAEVEVPEDFLELSDFDWDCIGLDNGHDAWVRDDALFRPRVNVARIGARSRVPLPAYVLGVDGERTVGATMALDDLKAEVTF